MLNDPMTAITLTAIMFGLGLCIGWLFGHNHGRAAAWFEYKRDKLRDPDRQAQADVESFRPQERGLHNYFGPDHPDDIERQRGGLLTAEEAGRSVT